MEGPFSRIPIVAALAVAALIPAAAQAPTPQAQAAAPAARAAGVARTADGKPDFQGTWQVMNTAEWDLLAHQARRDVPAGVGVVDGNEIPYLPAALAKKQENQQQGAAADPNAKCYLPGVPRIMYMPHPFQIVQTPKKLTMLFEYVHAIRHIYTDGSTHPDGHIDWWMGDSRARWEGDTLVVDNIHFNDQTWFDRAGNYHSEQLHVLERFTPSGPDHINYEATITDPKVFSRPWRMSMVLYRHKDPRVEVLEYECYAFDREFHAPVPATR